MVFFQMKIPLQDKEGSREVGRVFADFQIPVRWSKPETYHMTVLHVGERLSIFKRLVWRFKLKTICIKPFKVSLIQ